jgi:lipopolysaccharide transport system permease protein
MANARIAATDAPSLDNVDETAMNYQRAIITPGRIQIIGDRTGRLARVWDMARRTLLIARWNLHTRAFDKATGQLFLIVDPLVQALLYFYIVYVVFGARGEDVSYVAIFTMVTLWRGHAMIFGNAPTYLSSQITILQQTRYPPVALISEGIGTDVALFMMMNVIVLLILALSGNGPYVTWLAYPLVLVVNLLFSSACAVLLAMLGVYLRETGIVANFVVSLWMYASPVVYGMERIREPLRTIYLWVNPFAHIMPAYRSALLQNEWPQFLPLIVIALISLAVMVVSVTALERLRGRIYRFL